MTMTFMRSSMRHSTAAFPGLGRKGKGPSDPRGRKMADALGTLFKWAKQQRRVKTNSALDVYRPGPPKSRERILNTKPDVRGADELRWCWAAASQMGYPYGSLLQVLLLTGARLNEIARMQWAELSDDLSTLHLPGTRTKNHRAFLLPLSAPAREILASAPRVSGTYVFSTNGTTPISGFSKYKARFDVLMLAEAVKERGKGTTIAGWRLHDLRRSASSGMAAIGIAPHIIEAILNHVSGTKAGVAGTYNVEAYEPEKSAALARWASHIEGIVSGKRDRHGCFAAALSGASFQTDRARG